MKNSSLCPNCRQPIKVGTKPSHSTNYEANRNNSQSLSRTQNVNTNQNQPLFQSQIRNNQNANQNQPRFIIPNTNPQMNQNTRTNQVSNIQRVPSFNSNNNPNGNPFGNRGRNDW